MVARSAAALKAKYSDRPIIGDFQGRLSHHAGQVALIDLAGNEVGPNAKRSPDNGKSGPYRDGLVFRWDRFGRGGERKGEEECGVREHEAAQVLVSSFSQMTRLVPR